MIMFYSRILLDIQFLNFFREEIMRRAFVTILVVFVISGALVAGNVLGRERDTPLDQRKHFKTEHPIGTDVFIALAPRRPNRYLQI